MNLIYNPKPEYVHNDGTSAGTKLNKKHKLVSSEVVRKMIFERKNSNKKIVIKDAIFDSSKPNCDGALDYPNITNIEFENCYFKNSYCLHSNLNNVKFKSCTFDNYSFDQCRFKDVEFNDVKLTNNALMNKCIIDDLKTKKIVNESFQIRHCLIENTDFSKKDDLLVATDGTINFSNNRLNNCIIDIDTIEKIEKKTKKITLTNPYYIDLNLEKAYEATKLNLITSLFTKSFYLSKS